jgi:hypothetical protein
MSTNTAPITEVQKFIRRLLEEIKTDYRRAKSDVDISILQLQDLLERAAVEKDTSYHPTTLKRPAAAVDPVLNELSKIDAELGDLSENEQEKHPLFARRCELVWKLELRKRQRIPQGSPAPEIRTAESAEEERELRAEGFR